MNNQIDYLFNQAKNRLNNNKEIKLAIYLDNEIQVHKIKDIINFSEVIFYFLRLSNNTYFEILN